jgi:TonB family protein
VGEGSGSGTGGGEGDGGTGAAGSGFTSRVADRREPEVLQKGDLEYPASAVTDGVEGTVRLRVLVGEAGEVLEVEVIESSGDRRLDVAAEEFVRRWRYLPAVQDGKPRRVHTEAKVVFQLT